MLLSFVVASCSPYKNTHSPKHIVTKQKISGNKEFEKWRLEEFYRLHVNKRVLGFIPSYYPHEFGKKKKILFVTVNDTAKIRAKIRKFHEQREEKLSEPKVDSFRVMKRYNKKLKKKKRKLNEGTWLTRAVGEPPTLYDSASVYNTSKNLQAYMRSKGYLSATSEVQLKEKPLGKRSPGNKKVNIKYALHEGYPHTIAEVNYFIEDPHIEMRHRYYRDGSLLKVGKNYDLDLLSKERAAITHYMKNYGLYKFDKKYISYDVDTFTGDYEARINVHIANAQGNQPHRTYKINKIFFTIDSEDGLPSDTTKYKGIYFIHSSEKYNHRILSRHLHFKPGELYKLNNFTKSQNELGSINIFKYINISFQELDSNLLNVFVFTSPFKKYQISAEGGMSVNLQGQTQPGPFFNLTFRDRNVFNGFEIFETSLRYSLEGQISLTDNTKVKRIQEFDVNTSLIFPKILIPTRIKHKFSGSNPKTRLTIGLSDIDRQEYKRTNFKMAMNYSWQPNRKGSFIVTPFDLNIIRSKIRTDAFRDYLQDLSSQGNNLIQSFEQSIVSGLTLTRIYNNNFYQGRRKAWYNKITFESGGTMLGVIDKVFKEQDNDSLLKLPFYKFLKIQVDLRHYFPVSNSTTIVGRINAGIARPYGALRVLPYEKFFFTGGSNSIRAWNPRRLGPGSFTPDTSSNGLFDYRFEQPGEIILEANLELRGRLFGFMHGALFLDAGNVWTIREDQSRPGAQFEVKNFMSEIALGTGAGLRFDFSFLILRLDLGLKMYDPARSPGNRWVKFGSKGQSAFNFGIGYPF